MSATPLGAALINGLDRMEEGALTVERRIASRDTGLQGAVTVTSLDRLGDHVVAPIVARFGAVRPLVTIELLNDARVFNLSRREADVAFRFGSFDQELRSLRAVLDTERGELRIAAAADRLKVTPRPTGASGANRPNASREKTSLSFLMRIRMAGIRNRSMAVGGAPSHIVNSGDDFEEAATVIAGEWVNLSGRTLVAFYFLWAAAFNIRNWNFNLTEFRRIGVGGGPLLLPMGLVLQTLGSILLVYPHTITVGVGAALLIVFTLTSDILFHRYWTYTDPTEQTVHKQFLFEHVAVIGGIIGLAGPHI